MPHRQEGNPVHHLIAEMTLEEKVSLLSGGEFWSTEAIDRLGIPSMVLTDGPHGVRRQQGAADHVGVHESEPATAFPPAAASGSSWDPALLAEMGQALGKESLALDVDVLLGPGVNIKRSPLGGRSFEYFSEDPLLSGVLGAAWVRGIEKTGVGASVKHFAANNQETDRMTVSADVDERSLREIYLPAFERTVVEGRPSTVMCSYNKINGVYASQNSWLLSKVLREDWGFTGYVVSDWGAVVDPAAAVAAGLDLEMPPTGGRSENAIIAAVQEGRLDEALIDQAVSRILLTHDELLRRRGEATEAPVNFDAHHTLARRIAVESTVLLRNEGGLLPLDPETGATIAVIGEFARTPRFQGAGSSFVNPTRVDTALDSITARTSRPVTFSAGFRLDGEIDLDLREEAVAAAHSAEIVVLFLGLPPSEESEGFDRTHLDISPVQQDLAHAVINANPRTIVVLSNGAVVTLPPKIAVAPGLIEAWLGGQASGSALTEVLFGDSEPGGRLAETIPLSLKHTPAYANWPGSNGNVLYGERIYVGYRWYDTTDRTVAYPFGFGLSYTTFEYSDLEVQNTPGEAQTVVSFTVKNTGSRAGAEVAQLYVHDVEASVDRPLRELKGFEKLHLEAGEERRVIIELDSRAFAFWGPAGWTVEAGDFDIQVGSHSRDARLTASVTLDVPTVANPLNEDSTLHDWMAHPVGSHLVNGMFDGWAEGGSTEVTGIDLFKLIGGMPLRTLLSFNSQADENKYSATEALERLLNEANNHREVASR